MTVSKSKRVFQPERHQPARGRPENAFRVLVAICGLLVLVWVTLYHPPQPGFLDDGLVLAIFALVPVVFPLSIFEQEENLLHIITIGGGILLGASLGGWAVVAGLLLGKLVRGYLTRKHAVQGLTPLSWLDLAYQAGFQSGILVVALAITGWLDGINSSSGLSGPVLPEILAPLLIVALFHGARRIWEGGEIKPDGGRQRSAYFRDLVGLAILELIPLPFIVITLMGYPATGIGTAIMLGGIPSVIAVLLFGVSIVQNDLERRVEELSILNQVSRVLQSSLEMENVYRVLQEQVSRFLGVDNFYVALYKPEEQLLWYPLAVKCGEYVDWPPRSLADRLTDRVIRTGEPILLSQHAQEEMERIGLPPSVDAPSAWMGVPLIWAEQVIGCLAVFSNSPETIFNQDGITLLTTLSGQTSVAIQNALLYAQAQKRAAHLETINQITTVITATLDLQDVLSQVCQSVVEIAGASKSALYLLDVQQSRVELAHSKGFSRQFVDQSKQFSMAHDGRTRCLRTGAPVLVPNLDKADTAPNFIRSLRSEGISAFGDFPLSAPDGPIGYLSVYFSELHAFTGEEIDLLQTVAAQAALAVSNARLYERTDLALSKRVNQLSILEAVSRELAAAIQSDRLFEMILDYAMEYTHSRWGSLSLYNPQSGRGEVKAVRGYSVPLTDAQVADGVSGRALVQRKTLNLPDVSTVPDYLDLTEGTARSELCVPLFYEERILGVLTLESAEPAAYSADDQAFVEQLATQAAIAVLNAELYRQVQQRLAEQQALYRLGVELAGSLELNTILGNLAGAFKATIHPLNTAIYLRSRDASKRGWQCVYLEESGACFAASFSIEDDLLDGWSALPQSGSLLLKATDGAAKRVLRACSSGEILLLPLVVQQHLGFVVLHWHDEREIAEDTLRTLHAISVQGALALQNALLFRDASHRRDQLSAVLNSVAEGFLMVDDAGVITLQNESLSLLTGLPAGSLIGKPLSALPEDSLVYLGLTSRDLESLAASLARGQVPMAAKRRVVYKEAGQDHVLERSSFPVWGRDGKAIGWMIVLRDMTDEYQVAQARELITETLVHDLRSPVSAVLGALDILREATSEDKEIDRSIVSQGLSVARRGAKRVLGLIEILLDIARLQSGDMETTRTTTRLAPLVENVVDEMSNLAQEYGVILRNQVMDDIPPVRADVTKIVRVITNLVDNALKFTPAGGQVILSTAMQTDRMLALRVSDTGPGVPPEYREKIFERFNQVPGLRGRRRGSGLGLTFCRLAVDAHGGRIWVEPRPGGGSVFVFTLPIAQVFPSAQPPSKEKPPLERPQTS